MTGETNSIILDVNIRGGAAAKESLRLFTKNTGPCEAERQCIGADAWPVLEGHVRRFTPPIQALANAGRNYNGPKVEAALEKNSTICWNIPCILHAVRYEVGTISRKDPESNRRESSETIC